MSFAIPIPAKTQNTAARKKILVFNGVVRHGTCGFASAFFFMNLPERKGGSSKTGKVDPHGVALDCTREIGPSRTGPVAQYHVEDTKGSGIGAWQQRTTPDKVSRIALHR